MSEIAAVILAAGSSSRFRAAAGASGPSTKLVATYDGAPIVRRVAEAARASRARPVVVVTGHASQDVCDALTGLDVTLAHNPDFATGLASSLRTAVAALPAGSSGAVILLGDMPLISAALIDRLITVANQNPSAKAVVPMYDGARGNPVLIARTLFGEVGGLTGDIGARALLRSAGHDVVEIEADDAVAFDVDTPDALTKI